MLNKDTMIDEIRTRLAAATPGPWEYDVGDYSIYNPWTMEKITSLFQELPDAGH